MSEKESAGSRNDERHIRRRPDDFATHPVPTENTVHGLRVALVLIGIAAATRFRAASGPSATTDEFP
jgi:hypothetical protein